MISGIWKRSFPYAVASNISLAEAKKNLSDLLQKIKDCKVIVAAEVSGQLYYLAEYHHMNSYNANGEPREYLDSILEAELTEQNMAPSQKLDDGNDPTKPHPTERDGVYYINLSKAMATNPCLTSKSLLRPIIAEGNFNELLIECDHIPRWFETDLKAQGLSHSTSELSEHKFVVTITIDRASLIQ